MRVMHNYPLVSMCRTFDCNQLYRYQLYTTRNNLLSDIDFYDTILDAESLILNVYPCLLKYVPPIYLCAWMNDRVLDNCMNEETYNVTVLYTLNSICEGKHCNPQLCLLTAEWQFFIATPWYHQPIISFSLLYLYI